MNIDGEVMDPPPKETWGIRASIIDLGAVLQTDHEVEDVEYSESESLKHLLCPAKVIFLPW